MPFLSKCEAQAQEEKELTLQMTEMSALCKTPKQNPRKNINAVPCKKYKTEIQRDKKKKALSIKMNKFYFPYLHS